MIQCPVCLNNDQIRKVSSIVGSGSTTGYTTGWVGDSSYSVRHFSQNSLASQLSYEHPWDPPGCLIFIGAIYALAAFGPDFIRFLTGGTCRSCCMHIYYGQRVGKRHLEEPL